MCRRARASEWNVEYLDGSLPDGAPALDVDALYTAVAALERGCDRVAYLSAGMCADMTS